MIIDSHAHYTNPAFCKPAFRYLTLREQTYALQEGDRAQLFQALEEAGIACSVEPGISLRSCREVLQLCREYPGRVFPAMGFHPTRAIFEPWAARRELWALSAEPEVVAIGETGLDYHYPRKEQHRLKQVCWFLLQLRIARKRRLPVILHVRQAHKDALRILRRHPARKLGGVIHCFQGTPEEAMEYVRLGYHVGIGGALLQQPERAAQLWEAVAQIPLERILIETDAPFILPYCRDVLSGKSLRRARNTSLILPAVIEKIAAIRGLTPAVVEQATAENAIRLFRLPIENP